MKIIFIFCIIIVFIILLLSVLTTSKTYQYKHTVDPIKKPDDGIDNNQNESNEIK